jgi:hypothetical protein
MYSCTGISRICLIDKTATILEKNVYEHRSTEIIPEKIRNIL